MSNYSNEEAIASTETSSKENKPEEVTTLQGIEQLSTFDPIERIIDGFNYFKINEFDKYPAYYHQLAERQEPKFLVFACSDSRVCPTNILNLRPGEAFMTRNIANLVPTFDQLRYSGVGAVIEYAILALEVEVILVIGHSRCGGIQRLLSLPDKETSYDFIDDWVKIALPAKDKAIAENPDVSNPEELQTLVEKESVRQSLVNLLSYPYIRTGLADKKLKLIGGYYDFVCGKFEFLKVDFEIKPTIHV